MSGLSRRNGQAKRRRLGDAGGLAVEKVSVEKVSIVTAVPSKPTHITRERQPQQKKSDDTHGFKNQRAEFGAVVRCGVWGWGLGARMDIVGLEMSLQESLCLGFFPFFVIPLQFSSQGLLFIVFNGWQRSERERQSKRE